MKIKIGIIQPQAKQDFRAVIRHSVDFCQKAIEAGCHLILLPELFASGYTYINDWTPISDFYDEQLSGFWELVNKYTITIVVGSIPFKVQGLPEKETPNIYNRAVALSSEEPHIVSYDKLQLFYPFDEHKMFIPGCSFGDLTHVKVDDRILTAGILICNDLRYPEICRRYSKLGCELLLCPSRFSLKRLNAWRILTAARAIENQCIMVAANVCNEKYGPSRIIEPDGNVIFESKPEPELQIAEADLEKIYTERNELAVMARRRTDIYDTE